MRSKAVMGQAAAVNAPRSLARVDALLNQLTSRDFSVLVVAATMLGHPEWVLWLAAVGTHVFWVGFLALQLYVFKAADAEPAQAQAQAQPRRNLPRGTLINITA